MKKIFALLITTLVFMTACQPTPEGLVVQNKADDELKEAISVTAPPTDEPVETTATPEQTLRAEGTSANDTGTITVNYDAEVILPGMAQIPVAYMEPADFTQERLDKIITAFFGEAVFYDPYVMTKSEIEDTVVRIRQSATDLNSDLAQGRGIDNLEDLQKAAEKQIASLEKEWQDAPAEQPVIETSGMASSDDFSAKAKIEGKEDIGYLDYTNRAPFIYVKCISMGGTYNLRERRLEVQSSTELKLDMEEAGFQSARQVAQDFIERTEIEGVKLGEAYLSIDNIGLSQEGVRQKAAGVVGNREFYVFCFERIVGEGTVDKTFYKGWSSEDDYSEPRAYEDMQVWVENGELVQFIWDSPAKTGSMVNENAQMQMDYTQAMKTASDQAMIKYADLRGGNLKDMIIDINKIKFALVRIKERNSDNYLVVPAWKFYGEISGRYTEEAINEGYYGASADYVLLNEPESKNLITVNALDGTVINMRLGY